MIVDYLRSLPYCKSRAVIINYNTKLVTTLALLSALRYAKIPLLLIDCESTDGSMDHFSRLSAQYEFDILSMPLREHGKTLDTVFAEIPADNVLAIDSDLEIFDKCFIEFCFRYIDCDYIYGCGFTSGPQILGEEAFLGTPLEGAFYDERFWMPIVMLKVAPVRKALEKGISFASRVIDNEYGLLRVPMRLRNLPVLRRLLKTGPVWLRHPYHTTLRPSIIYNDTGSLMDHHLRYHQRLYFAGLPGPSHGDHVCHYFGTTRNAINPEDRHGGGGNTAIAERVRQRLVSEYAFEM